MVVAGSTAANEKFSMGRSDSILVVRLAGRTYWMGCFTEILQYTLVMAFSMERLYMEAQDGLKTIAPPLFLNIFFYFLLV